MVDRLSFPLDLVFIRHGESEGNVAHRLEDATGIKDLAVELDEKKDTFDYRLTDVGIEQARLVGKWVKENMFPKFDTYYASDFLRTRETAAYLDFPDANWMLSPWLREQYHNDEDEPSFYLNRTIGPECFLSELKETASVGPRVLVVCHATVIHSFMILLERLSYISNDTLVKDAPAVHNCAVLWYTRRNPVNAAEISPTPKWRSLTWACAPDATTPVVVKWKLIKRQKFTTAELLLAASSSPRIITRKLLEEATREKDHISSRAETSAGSQISSKVFHCDIDYKNLL